MFLGMLIGLALWGLFIGQRTNHLWTQALAMLFSKHILMCSALFESRTCIV